MHAIQIKRMDCTCGRGKRQPLPFPHFPPGLRKPASPPANYKQDQGYNGWNIQPPASDTQSINNTLPALAKAFANAGSVPSAAAIVFMSQRPNFIYTIYTLFHQWSCILVYPVTKSASDGCALIMVCPDVLQNKLRLSRNEDNLQ